MLFSLKMAKYLSIETAEPLDFFNNLMIISVLKMLKIN